MLLENISGSFNTLNIVASLVSSFLNNCATNISSGSAMKCKILRQIGDKKFITCSFLILFVANMSHNGSKVCTVPELQSRMFGIDIVHQVISLKDLMSIISKDFYTSVVLSIVPIKLKVFHNRLQLWSKSYHLKVVRCLIEPLAAWAENCVLGDNNPVWAVNISPAYGWSWTLWWVTLIQIQLLIFHQFIHSHCSHHQSRHQSKTINHQSNNNSNFPHLNLCFQWCYIWKLVVAVVIFALYISDKILWKTLLLHYLLLYVWTFLHKKL